jgi:hypothetical protein
MRTSINRKEYPPITYIPEGETLEGYLVDISNGKSRYGACQYAALKKDAESLPIAVCMSASLKFKILEENIGFRHWITNTGRVENPNTGMVYQDYDVDIDVDDALPPGEAPF